MGWKGEKKNTEVLYWELDVISVAAPAELFSTNDCNYTVSTVRVIRLRCLRILVWIIERYDEAIRGAAALLWLHASLCFNTVNSHSLLWKQSQAAPLRAFKRLLKVLVSPILDHSIATHTSIQPSLSPFKSRLLKASTSIAVTPLPLHTPTQMPQRNTAKAVAPNVKAGGRSSLTFEEAVMMARVTNNFKRDVLIHPLVQTQNDQRIRTRWVEGLE